MATFYITEYARSANDGVGQPLPAGLEPARATQTITIGAASAQATDVITAKFVRMHAEAACHFRFGINPTATTADAKMATGQTEFIGVVPGMKIAVIAGA